jgi:hypothetical protein
MESKSHLFPYRRRPIPESRGSVLKNPIWLAIFIAIPLSSAVWAQTPQISAQRQRVLEEPFRLMMDQQVPTEKRVLFDWGGWFRSNYWAIDEDTSRDLNESNPKIRDDGYHAFREQQLRLWGLLNLDQVHQVYARMKLDYWDWNDHTSYNGNDSDWDGANLERGFYDFRLSRYQMAYGEKPGDFDFSARLGRQYVEFGNGLTLSIPLDALLVSGYYDNFKVTGLGAWSIPSTYNIDRSVPDNEKESRRYWGVQVEYSGFHDHTPFVYYLNQEDLDAGMVRPVNGIDQAFGIDSQYVGLGSQGRFFHRDLQYSVEGVIETGKSYAYTPDTDESASRQSISAWAFDTELRYLVPDKKRTLYAVEYLLASGDSDRYFSPIDTVGGNQPGTLDRSFSAWGFRNTGLVFAPMISNLGMVRLGASTFPWENFKAFKDLELGANVFFYHKQRESGAASDNLSFRDHSYLGNEYDFYANWWFTSDLAITAHYAFFLPGEAFPSQSDRQLFYTALTLSF